MSLMGMYTPKHSYIRKSTNSLWRVFVQFPFGGDKGIRTGNLTPKRANFRAKRLKMLVFEWFEVILICRKGANSGARLNI